MKPVSRALLDHIQELVPLGAEVIPLDWAYEDEDYNIAVLIDDSEDARNVEERLLEAIIDYDEAHDTFTICMVWPKRERTLAGVR